MRLLTFMDLEEINEYEQMMKEVDYQPNTAQKRLAEEVTTIVHGKDGLQTALKVTEGIKPGAMTTLDAATLEAITDDVASATLSLEKVLGYRYTDLLVEVGLLNSKGEARRLINNGGAYLNNERINDENLIIENKHVIDGRFLLLGAGKKKKMLIRITSS